MESCHIYFNTREPRFSEKVHHEKFNQSTYRKIYGLRPVFCIGITGSDHSENNSLNKIRLLKRQLHLILLFLAELYDNDCVKENLAIKINAIDTH